MKFFLASPPLYLNMHRLGLLTKYRELLQRTNLREYFPDVITAEKNVLGFSFPKDLDLRFVGPGLIDPYFDAFSRMQYIFTGPFTLLIADILNQPLEPILPLAIGAELLTSALSSLDDLGDGSLNRAGRPCCYRIYGNQAFMNVGEFMLMEMPRVILKMNILESTKLLLVDDFLVYVRMFRFYQAIEFQMTQRQFFASVEQYCYVDGGKNGVIATLPASVVLRMHPVSAELKKALFEFCSEVQLFMQLINDVNSVENEEYYKKKGTGQPGEDFLNGRVNAILAQAIENMPTQKERIKEIITLETRDQSMVDELLSIVHESKAISCIKDMLHRRVEEKWETLSKLIPESEAKNELFHFKNNMQTLKF